jgi:ankyrin repeat protein
VTRDKADCKNNSLNNILKEMKELPDFHGINLSGVNDKGAFGNTPLHIAAIRGDIDAVQILLDYGAEINAQGEGGYTPLHEAVEQGHYDIVELLFKNGSSVSIKNEDELTAIDLAKITADNNIIKLLKSSETFKKKEKG